MYEVQKHLATLRENSKETVELNLVFFAEVQQNPLRVDLRKWGKNPDGSRGQMYRNGISLSFEEAAALRDELNDCEELNAWKAEQEPPDFTPRQTSSGSGSAYRSAR